MTSCEEARQRAENRESNVDRSVWANKLLAGGFPRPDLPRNFLTFWGMSCVGVPSTSHHSLPRSVSAHICEDNYRKRYGEFEADVTICVSYHHPQDVECLPCGHHPGYPLNLVAEGLRELLRVL